MKESWNVRGSKRVNERDDVGVMGERDVSGV